MCPMETNGSQMMEHFEIIWAYLKNLLKRALGLIHTADLQQSQGRTQQNKVLLRHPSAHTD